MGYQHIKQALWRKIRTVTRVASAGEETELTASQCTEAYRKANLVVGTHLMELQDWTNGLFLAFELSNDAEVAAGVTIWGYAPNGPAVLIDTIGTIVGGTQVSDDGGYWAEEGTPGGDTDQTVSFVTATNRMGRAKFDTEGLKYIYVQVTTFGQTDGTVSVWARPW